jgi:hypothetical protein
MESTNIEYKEIIFVLGEISDPTPQSIEALHRKTNFSNGFVKFKFGELVKCQSRRDPHK